MSSHTQMADRVELRLVQFAPTWLDPVSNTERTREIAVAEAESGADIVVFPELSNVGYVTPIRIDNEPQYPEGLRTEAEFRSAYRAASETVAGPFVAGLSEVAQNHRCVIVAGMARLEGENLMNSAVILGPTGVLGIHDKLHIPPQETPFFIPGRRLEVYETPVARLGLSVCYDSRFPEMARFHRKHGADVSLVVYAGADSVVSLLGEGEALMYRTHVRAQENGIFFAVCNRVGMEGSSRFFGKSVVAAPSGAILAQGDGAESTVTATLKASDIRDAREIVDVMADRRPELYG